MAPELDQLTKQDLFILMDSYRNNIQLNSTLLEQQRQMLVLLTQTIEKQKETYGTIDELMKKLDVWSEKISSTQASLNNSLSGVSNKISLVQSTILSKLNLAFVGLGTIVLAVIGLAVTFVEKYLPLADLITKHLGGGK